MCMKTSMLVQDGGYPNPRYSRKAKVVKRWKSIDYIDTNLRASYLGPLRVGGWKRRERQLGKAHADFGFHVFVYKREASKSFFGNCMRLVQVECSGLIGKGYGDGAGFDEARVETYEYIRIPKLRKS